MKAAFLRMLALIVFLPAVVTTLCGCVAGQAIALRHAPGTGPEVTSARTVSVDVTDSRQFIVNGNKAPSYLGHFRAGFGNTWDVNNAGHRALADQFRADLMAELESRGIKTIASGERRLLVDIKQWNCDAYQNGKIWYEIAVSVNSAEGTPLAGMTLKAQKIIRGSFWLGPVGAFKREVPVIYSGIIRDILGDSRIQLALK